MAPDTLASVAAIDPARLTEVVRHDQRSPGFVLDAWTVTPLAHHTIIDTTGGLFCFCGRGHDDRGERPWSVVLKIVNDPGHANANHPRNWAYWRREPLVFQSGLLANLQGPFAAPRCYGVQDLTSGAWLWLEHIVETTPRRWATEHYTLAARHLGIWQGTAAAGASSPTQPWLVEGFLRSVYAPDDWWTPHNGWTRRSQGTRGRVRSPRPGIPPSARSAPCACSVSASASWRPSTTCPRCYATTTPIGATCSSASGWMGSARRLRWTGHSPAGVALGADASALVMTSLFYFEQEPSSAHELETHVLEAYVGGLHAAGWDGDVRLVRLGYLASVALGHGISLPGWTGYMLGAEQLAETTRQYGRSADEIADGWLRLWEYAHTCADVAIALMHAFGFA
jgi:hypothetical protein